MASNADFVQYIVDQCSGAGEITFKKMMGDYCIYCDGTIFGLVCSQELRAFFQQHMGKGFHFKVEFQKWLHENAGKTYRDAVEAYKMLEQHTGI